METGENGKDNYQNQSEPKRIKLEDYSADVELEDSQKWQPQSSVHNFSCHKCPEGFATSEEIVHHWTEKHGLHPANCSVCNANFPTSTEMWDHKVAIHGIPCELCENFFETEEKLMDHVKSVHLKNESDMEENERGNFKDAEDHQDIKPTEYFDDGTGIGIALSLSTNSKIELETKPPNSEFQSVNMKSEVPSSNDPSFTCHLCPEVFQTMPQIKHHWFEKHDLKPAHCIFCKKPFPSARLMGVHKKEVHGITCEICHKVFRKQIGLEDHIKQVHGLVKQNCCTICGLVFTRELDLKKHVVESHSDVPGSIKRCDVCQYTCLTEEDLIKHKGKHMASTCPVCGIVLESRGAAKRHRQETKHQALL